MYSKIAKFGENSIMRNVMIVFTGTAASQAIAMLFSPVITRLYGPEAFGVLGVFLSIVGIVSPVAALTYPIAIVLPKSDSDAKRLITLSLYVSTIVALSTVLVLLLFTKPLVGLLQIAEIEQFLYLIPVVIFSSGFQQVTQQWLIRTKQFTVTAKAAFLKSLLLNSSKAFIGWFNPVATSLIILTALGNALHGCMLMIGVAQAEQKFQLERVDLSEIVKLAKRYCSFPLFRAPQVLLNATSQSLPVLGFCPKLRGN